MSDPTSMISQNEIKNQGKIFKISTYNDIGITIDTETGYINATKLRKNVNKDFRTFCKSMRYRELVNFLTMKILLSKNAQDLNMSLNLNFLLKLEVNIYIQILLIFYHYF